MSMITRAGFGDVVTLTAPQGEWPPGTSGRVRQARVGVALVELLDDDQFTLDLIFVPYESLELVRRAPRSVSPSREAGTPRGLLR